MAKKAPSKRVTKVASAAKPRPTAAHAPHAAKHPPYAVHPGIAMVQNWIAALPEKTGRSLDEWLRLIKKEGPADEVGRREWLKYEHKMGTNSAWWLAERSVGKGGEEDSPEGYLKQAVKYVDDMYASKPALRPLYEALATAAIRVGKDCGHSARLCPCKTMVPIYRENVVAQIKPTTKTRIDFGLCLKDYKGKIPARVAPTGGAEKGDRITHRIEVMSASDIDAELVKWLKVAYELNA
jgi:hypothetical protein